jgi:hypothetical protein
MEFAPCPACHRHVRVSPAESEIEPACPFCAAAIRDAQPVHRSLVGRASRAAVFASAATLAGCYTSSTTQGPPPPPPDPNGGVYEPDPGDARFAKPPQSDRGAISGVLKNPDGRTPAANHPITLHGGNEHRDTTTDARGAYAFGDLPPGSYTITFQPSYHPRQAPAMAQVEVIAGTNTRVDFALHPVPPPDRGPCCKPYGAPPARRRIV